MRKNWLLLFLIGFLWGFFLVFLFDWVGYLLQGPFLALVSVLLYAMKCLIDIRLYELVGIWSTRGV